MTGWIKIHRAISDHWIYQNESYLKAWITILITVNHEPKKVLIHGELITCDRGQSVLSLASWAKFFGRKWSIQRVRTLFCLLENDKMITIEGLQKTTRLTVCKYEDYQNGQQTVNKQSTDGQQTDNKEPTDSQQQLKNEKKVKNEKKIIRDSTESQLCISVLEIIRSIKSDRMGSTVKEYKLTHERIKMVQSREGDFRRHWPEPTRDFLKACRYAFEYKSKEWFGTKMWNYFEPATLLTGKFIDYLETAEQNRGIPYVGEPKKKEEEKVLYQIPK